MVVKFQRVMDHEMSRQAIGKGASSVAIECSTLKGHAEKVRLDTIKKAYERLRVKV